MGMRRARVSRSARRATCIYNALPPPTRTTPPLRTYESEKQIARALARPLQIVQIRSVDIALSSLSWGETLLPCSPVRPSCSTLLIYFWGYYIRVYPVAAVALLSSRSVRMHVIYVDNSGDIK